MDHLPKPAKPFRRPPYPEVPYLCASINYPPESVGYEAFLAFPARYGFTVEELQRGHWSLYDADDTLALLQSWLFFGVLTETFSGAGIPFNQEDFRRQTDGGQWLISTELLQRYKWYWIAAHCHQDFDSRRQHARLVDSCLQLSNTVHMAIISGSRSLLTDCSLDNPRSAVLLSIVILGEVLTHASNVITITISVRRWPFPPLTQALLAAGWCIRDITNMSKECDSSTLLYLSTLDHHALGKDHEQCSVHEGCQASVVLWDLYRTKHIGGCSEDQCDDIGASVEEVSSILRDGDIPLIAMDTSTSPSQIEVVRYKERSEYCNDYVAVSHVWSDGLGNPKANSLPRCQLERIQHLVNKLDPEETYVIPFWIDTICVPLEPELKSLAIVNMDKTYRNAKDVLVFDNSWKDMTVAMPAIEIMMRVRYSTWMTRLWTFQEGRLSRNLWFQLGDGPVHIDDVRGRCKPQVALQKVSNMLLEEDKTQLHAHPNKLQLARALAYRSPPKTQESLHKYAVLPKQKDEEEEAARLSAIHILSEQREGDTLRNTWHQITTEINPETPLSDRDGDVRDHLRNPVDNIHSYAMALKFLVKGIGDVYNIGKVSPQATKQGLRPARHLIDVVRGIRGRTTSRLEDETICLSVMLGLDVGRVTEITVLHWRWKDLLARLREFVVFLGRLFPHQHVFHGFADIIEKVLRQSHEERMEVFLSQFQFVPKAVLFWNTPRLRRKRWRWAPFSFLPEDLNIDAPLKGGNRGYVTRQGLLVRCPAVRLRSSSFLHGSEETMELPRRYNHLCIDWSLNEEELQNNADPAEYEVRKQRIAAKVWKWVRLRQTVTWPVKASTNLENNVRKRVPIRLLILLEEHWSTKKKGALVSIYKKQGRCICASYVMALTAVEEEPSQHTLRISGQWVRER